MMIPDVPAPCDEIETCFIEFKWFLQHGSVQRLFDLCPILFLVLKKMKIEARSYLDAKHTFPTNVSYYFVLHIQAQCSMINVGFRLTNFKMLRDRWNKCGGKLFLNWYFFLDAIHFFVLLAFISLVDQQYWSRKKDIYGK